MRIDDGEQLGHGDGRRDALCALGVALALACIYAANGEVLPGNDATSNLYLAANLGAEGRLTFTPSRDPWLFYWSLATPRGPALMRVLSLDAPVADSTARRLMANGQLTPVVPYYLMATTARDPETGEPQYLGTYGIGTGLAAAPVLAVARVAFDDLRRAPQLLWQAGKLVALLFTAAATAIVFLASRRFVPRPQALLLALACGLGTSLWSTSSQTLWQHAPDSFFVTLGLFVLTSRRRSVAAAMLGGAALAAATVCRPTSGLFLAVKGAHLLVTGQRRSFLGFAAAAAPILFALAAFNLHFTGSLLRYAQAGHESVALGKTGATALWQGRPWETLPGLLVSPSRGLLVFSPFLLLAVRGALLAWRRDSGCAELRPVVVTALLLLGVDAFWFDWWGGWSYGARRLVDLTPALILLAAPALPWVFSVRWRRLTLFVLVGWSVALQALGAFTYEPEGWNARRQWLVESSDGSRVIIADEARLRALVAGGARVVSQRGLDVDRPEHRARLWSWRDSQVVFCLRDLGAARERKRAAYRTWLDAWRLPPRPPSP